MTDSTVPSTILILAGPVNLDRSENLDTHRRSWSDDLARAATKNLHDVNIVELQGQVNVFLQQMNQILIETPEQVGQFRLSEFEVSAGLVVEAKGEVRLALLANAQAGGSINAGLKFVFKRS